MIGDSPGRLLLRAGLLCGVWDGTFSSVLAVVYQRPVARLWQGVAATLFGPSMLDSGAGGVLIGLALHFGVAFTWSAVFLLLVTRSARLRRFLDAGPGRLATAAVYGPLVWMVMSLGVIPLLSHQPPAITMRWWIQFFGHMVFVALPIVAALAPEGSADVLTPRRPR